MRLLIIEDDHRFAAILADFARDKRFKVLVAHSARRGVALAQRFQPVAITLDLRLVDQDSWLVLDQLKHDERTRHIPVHVISVEPGRNRGLRLGAVSYLQKPVTKEAINNILQQTVDFIERPVKNLLVVEDDLAFSRFLYDLAHEKGFKALVTSRGVNALALARELRPSAITLDISLPDIDGWRVLERLKEDAATRHIPIHFISVADEPERALKQGALGFLHKPADRAALQNWIARELDAVAKALDGGAS